MLTTIKKSLLKSVLSIIKKYKITGNKFDRSHGKKTLTENFKTFLKLKNSKVSGERDYTHELEVLILDVISPQIVLQIQCTAPTSFF